MEKDFSSEFTFTASRSSGPGGQNVNKVSSKVMLCFQVSNSMLLTDNEKERINEKLANKINSDGVLQITSQSERTQLANKERCIEKFHELVKQALTIPKRRKRTRPSKAAVQRRIDAKKKLSEKKKSRGKLE